MKLRGALPLMLLLAAGCSRPAPSPEYSSAREKHAALLAQDPLGAASRPEMDEVLRLLDAVPEKSADAAAARELRDRIVAERDSDREEAARRAELVEEAAAAPSWPAASSIGRPAPPPRIDVGMSAEQFSAAHGACFERQAGEFELVGRDGKESPAEAWRLNADAECRERYGSLADQLVLVSSGVVAAVRPASDAKVVQRERVVERPVERQVELVQLPGGKWGVRGPDGKVEPLPPDARIRTVDGKPLPVATAEPRP